MAMAIGTRTAISTSMIAEDQQRQGERAHVRPVTHRTSKPRTAWASPISAVSASGGTMAA